QLMLIDLQEKLLPAMSEPDSILAKTEAIVASASELGVPVLASEQYPQGLGPTVSSLRGTEQRPMQTMAKMEFSCMANAELASRVLGQAADLHRNQVVIAGVEAHVCVLQTALDMLARGLQVYVVADAVGSRKPSDRQL